jgi:glycosyltransferase involved in cell wall biosynthesis
MKIQVFHSKGGGPGIFMHRLCNYLASHHDVKFVNKNPDIYFSAVWRGAPPKGCKVVHRVDNCYFDTLQKKRTGSNKAIALAIKKADGVIYQSDFSRKICKGILGVKARKYKIIYNAIDQTVCDNIIPINHGFEKIIVSSAIWRPLKRPNAIIKAFIAAAIPNAALYMIGELKPIVKSSNIVYVGKIGSEKIYSYYKAATAMIHISRLDACSNSVIEALSFGKPVICNNAGGTPEIVKKDGVIINIDPEDNYREFPMKNPEKVNINTIASGIKECLSKEWNIKRPEFDMSYCASQYYEFFKEILLK